MSFTLKPRILLLEQDPESNHAISVYLRQHLDGSKVLSCSSTEELRHRLQRPRREPDAVVCSEWFNGESVSELLDRLHRNRVFAPWVVLFDDEVKGSLSKSLPRGVRDYLIKDREGNYLRLLPVLLGKVLGRDSENLVAFASDPDSHDLSEDDNHNWFEEEVWIDLPQRVQVEGELRRVRSWLSALIEHQPAGILVELENGRIGLTNRKLCEMFQLHLPPEDLVDADWNVVARSAQGLFDDPDRFVSCIKELSGGRGSITGEEWLLADGRSLDMESAPIFKGDTLRGRIWLFRDISQRRRQEKALRWAARMEATATLAGGIAHDFNNLMQGVLGNAELLLSILPDNRQTGVMLRQIAGSAEKAGELAQQMLAYARGGRYQPRRMNLIKSIVEVLRLQDVANEGNIRIDLDSDPGLWDVHADPGQMAMIIHSLVSNAVEAIEKTGDIDIRTYNDMVPKHGISGFPFMTPGRYAVMEVRDSGSGMDHATIARVFEPFFSTKFQGRGLGLAAVYGIVKNHGGYITADSRAGRGSLFKVYLPACDVVNVDVQPSSDDVRRSEDANTVMVGKVGLTGSSPDSTG